jgi:hypothetical protein
MRRKVIQDFANVFCQRAIDLPDGFDLTAFAHHGSGVYKANILTGECARNEQPIPQLHTCEVYRDWLMNQLTRHGIPNDAIREASLVIDVQVNEIEVRASFGHRFASAHFRFDCRSELMTDEKSYKGKMVGDREWSFDWFDEKLYGVLPDAWPTSVGQ